MEIKAPGVCLGELKESLRRVLGALDFGKHFLEENVENITYEVPTLKDLCLKHIGCNERHPNEDKVLDYRAKKQVKNARKERKLWLQFIKQKKDLSPTDGMTVMTGIPERPYVNWIAVFLLKWEETGKIPLSFCSFTDLKEVDVFEFPEKCHEVVKCLSMERNLRKRESLLRQLVELLGEEGLRRCMNIRQTTGTVKGFWPPSRKFLIKAFQLPHTKGDRALGLSVGGRALSKHCIRCSKKWWGDATGPSCLVNWKAEALVNKILNEAVWLNVHHIPHEYHVFEARVAEGYGARWSADANEFRGFLEPPDIESGHENGWLH